MLRHRLALHGMPETTFQDRCLGARQPHGRARQSGDPAAELMPRGLHDRVDALAALPAATGRETKTRNAALMAESRYRPSRGLHGSRQTSRLTKGGGVP